MNRVISGAKDADIRPERAVRVSAKWPTLNVGPYNNTCSATDQWAASEPHLDGPRLFKEASTRVENQFAIQMLRLLLVISFSVQLQAGPLGRWSSSSSLDLQLSSVFRQVAGTADSVSHESLPVDSSHVPVVPEPDPSASSLTKKNQDINFKFQSLQNDILEVQTKIATLSYHMSSGQAVQSGPLELNERLGKFKANYKTIL